MNETRPSPFFALFRFHVLYWMQTEELKRGRPGNEATKNGKLLRPASYQKLHTLITTRYQNGKLFKLWKLQDCNQSKPIAYRKILKLEVGVVTIPWNKDIRLIVSSSHIVYLKIHYDLNQTAILYVRDTRLLLTWILSNFRLVSLSKFYSREKHCYINTSRCYSYALFDTKVSIKQAPLTVPAV